MKCHKCGTTTMSEYGLCRKCKKKALAIFENKAYAQRYGRQQR